jgi:L-ascorbate metabolism protein UlaG (beta-lactamase superfamily)
VELEFFGGNCFRIKTKSTTIVIDDNLNRIGSRSIQNDKTTAFYTSKNTFEEKSAGMSRLVIRTAGEFEVGDITVTGVQARSHTDTSDECSAVVFQFMHAAQTITILGHAHPDISDEVTELVSGTDVLVIPVGGNGFTLDPVGAVSIVKKTEPGIVVPSQYAIKGLSYEVEAQEIEEFVKVMSVPVGEPLSILKLTKVSDDTGVQAKIIILSSNK